jgi:alpha-1,6-mannosyltransferase
VAIKTLHLTNAYHPTSGGIRTFYRALLTRANEERRPMRLVVPGPDDGIEEVGQYGRIYFVAAPPAPAFDRRYRMMLPGHYLRGSARLREILRDEQADLIEICDKYSLFYLAALLRKGLAPGIKRPVLVGLSCERMDDNAAAYLGGTAAYLGGTAAYLGGGALRRALTGAYIRHLYGPPFDAHIANSEYTAEELRRSLWDRSPDFIQVCPMGVESSAFGPVNRDLQLRRRLLEDAGGTRNSVLLLYAGRLSPEKNPRLLIDTLERLARPGRFGHSGDRDYRLVLAGDGPSARMLMEEAQRLVPGRVLWIGAIQDRAELARLYASADAFVHPNPREPFGIGPLEAMASRVPVIVPSAGGVLSYASEQNAWLAAPDARSFALAIRTAVTRPDPARVAAAFDTARAFDWQAITARYFRLYDELHRRHLTKFALPISLSHTVVTELGQSALQPFDGLRAAPSIVEGLESR